MSRPIPEFKAGQVLKAEDLRALAQAIQEHRVSVAPPLTLQETPAGVLIGWSGEREAVLVKPTTATPDADGYYSAKVRILGPSGVIDWADCKVMVPS